MPQCTAIKQNNQQCTVNAVHPNGLCRRHETLRRQREVRDRITDLWDVIEDNIWILGITDPDMLMLPTIEAAAAGMIPPDVVAVLHDVVLEGIAGFHQFHAIPIGPDNRPELQRLAQDGQNVHTSAVNNQTNKSLELLLHTPVPDTQDTLQELWFHSYKKMTLRTYRDIKRWYATKSCRQNDDFLYKKVLDGLWTRVKTSKYKDELVKRLIEETTESVTMCCDGHIARLCNVLVGFDDSFVPQISMGEALQQKISAIAALDLSVEEKVVEAWNVFEELAVPMDQREAWIDAF